jgi:hypothetical protein
MYSTKTFNTKQVASHEDEPKSWPPKVTHRHPKSGHIIKQDNYIMRTVGSTDKNNRDRINYVEYPAGSGNLWDKKWNAIGRWDKNAPEGKRFIKGEAHALWAPPETEDQVLAKEMAQDKQRIAELEKELAAISAEKADKKSAPTKKDSGA